MYRYTVYLKKPLGIIFAPGPGSVLVHMVHEYGTAATWNREQPIMVPGNMHKQISTGDRVLFLLHDKKKLDVSKWGFEQLSNYIYRVQKEEVGLILGRIRLNPFSASTIYALSPSGIVPSATDASQPARRRKNGHNFVVELEKPFGLILALNVRKKKIEVMGILERGGATRWNEKQSMRADNEGWKNQIQVGDEVVAVIRNQGHQYYLADFVSRRADIIEFLYSLDGPVVVLEMRRATWQDSSCTVS
eukprot:g39954.t1